MSNRSKVEVTRLEKRKRKIIIVLESNLYSDEVFSPNPFYDEGEEENKLQKVHFNIRVTEEKGKLSAKVSFNGQHYTTGHRQIQNASGLFLDAKEHAIDTVRNYDLKYYFDGRIEQMIERWKDDKDFQKELIREQEKRHLAVKSEKLAIAQKEYQKALDSLNIVLDDLTKTKEQDKSKSKPTRKDEYSDYPF